MQNLTLDNVRGLAGGTLMDATGDRVGRIEDIYLDQDTNAPEWALVNTGLFGSKQTFVPLASASMQGNDSIQVPFEKAMIKDAPRVDAEGELSEDEERMLYQYYGLDYHSPVSDTTLATEATTTPQPAVQATTPPPTTTRDDAYVTRSEERVNVQKVRRPSQLVRLRKYITTEQVTQTVPVQREEIRIEREPITAANMGDAMSGPDMKEDVVEVALQEEDVTVQKEVVPVERIRVEKDMVTEQKQVSAEVRKEQIDVERVAGTTGTTTPGTGQVITDADNVEDPNRANPV